VSSAPKDTDRIKELETELSKEKKQFADYQARQSSDTFLKMLNEKHELEILNKKLKNEIEDNNE
jgi:hypothetical protein